MRNRRLPSTAAALLCWQQTNKLFPIFSPFQSLMPTQKQKHQNSTPWKRKRKASWRVIHAKECCTQTEIHTDPREHKRQNNWLHTSQVSKPTGSQVTDKGRISKINQIKSVKQFLKLTANSNF